MSDQSDLEAADDSFFDALNKLFEGDTAPMEALWSHAPDVVYMGPVPELFDIGWKGTDADWLKQSAQGLHGTISLVQRHVVLNEGLAVAHHIAEVSGQGPDGTDEKRRMRGTNVFRKEDGAWKMIAHHSDPLPYVKA